MTTASPRSTQWADPDHGSVQRLIDQSKEAGWRVALIDYQSGHPFFVKRMQDLGLGNWHVLFALPRDSAALDLGCGFGSLALGLGEYYRSVVGIDALPSRLEYASLRAKQDGRAENTFARASGLELPFREDCFDLVTLNGVLEWAGLNAKGDPRKLQIRMLREARRTLTSGGLIAVAIENRFAMETLAGMHDTHTGLRFVPVLPRMVADRVARAVKKEPFRTYLYDRAGYLKLVREAGFEQARVFDLASSYNDYDYVIDADDAASYRFLWGRNAVRTFYRRAGTARRAIAALRPSALTGVAYAYLVLAGRATLTVLDATHPFWLTAAQHGVDAGPARFACKGTEAGTMILMTHDGSKPGWMLEMSVGLSGGEKSGRGLEHFSKTFDTQAVPGPTWSANGIEVRTHRAISK